MGHELLTATVSHSASQHGIRKANQRSEILSELLTLRGLSENMQGNRFSVICRKYGQRIVIRVCCDLIMLSGGENIPIQIWDYASQNCSAAPALDPALREQITEKEITRIFRNCIVKEKIERGRIVAYTRKR